MADKQKLITDDIRAELKPELDALAAEQFAKGKAAGATEERERIRAVEDAGLPGFEKELEAMKFDGVTTGLQASKKMIELHKSKLGDKLKEIRSDATAPIADKTKAPDPTGGNAKADAQKADDDQTSSVATAQRLSKRANEYQAQKAKEGIKVSNEEAIKFAYEEAGVPLR